MCASAVRSSSAGRTRPRTRPVLGEAALDVVGHHKRCGPSAADLDGTLSASAKECGQHIELSGSQEDLYALLFGGPPGSAQGSALSSTSFATPARRTDGEALDAAHSGELTRRAPALDARSVDERLIADAVGTNLNLHPCLATSAEAKDGEYSQPSNGESHGGASSASIHPDAVRKELERAVKRALRGAAAERDRAVADALTAERARQQAESDGARAKFADDLARALAEKDEQHSNALQQLRAQLEQSAERAAERAAQGALRAAEGDTASALRALAASHDEAAARWAAEREAAAAKALKSRDRAVGEATVAARRRYEAELEKERKRLTEDRDKAMKAAAASALRARELAVARAVAQATAQAEEARSAALAELRAQLVREKEVELREQRSALAAEAAKLQLEADSARAQLGLQLAQMEQTAALKVGAARRRAAARALPPVAILARSAPSAVVPFALRPRAVAGSLCGTLVLMPPPPSCSATPRRRTSRSWRGSARRRQPSIARVPPRSRTQRRRPRSPSRRRDARRRRRRGTLSSRSWRRAGALRRASGRRRWRRRALSTSAPSRRCVPRWPQRRQPQSRPPSRIMSECF